MFSGASFLLREQLADRQILGTQKVLRSLAAEDVALSSEWERGQLPATVLQQSSKTSQTLRAKRAMI
jgi:hypothetical protein